MSRQRAFYFAPIANFCCTPLAQVLGQLAGSNDFRLEQDQRNAWEKEIIILKNQLNGLKQGWIILEYTIPRIGKRIDAVIIYQDLVFLLEFKVGASDFSAAALEQITDYALDLQDFHEESKNTILIPILIATKANSLPLNPKFIKSKISSVLCSNGNNLHQIITLAAHASAKASLKPINGKTWLNSPYHPTPTIIEAARSLYLNNSVADITRNDAGAINLSRTTSAISEIIDNAKLLGQKAICFVTGVPGAGKTLAGLNLAVDRQRIASAEHAVFLSGNGPLVEVLQEALARDHSQQENSKINSSRRKVKEFIQNIHHFRDEAISQTQAPIERVVIFDEAQRAWDKAALSKFMASKKQIDAFDMSEPEFLIGIMNRHPGWAVIICLIGGGQEINTGEAGLEAWFSALRQKFPNWKVHLPHQLEATGYAPNIDLPALKKNKNYCFSEDLHLNISLRSFRSKDVATFIDTLLDLKTAQARQLYEHFVEKYPLYLTRDLAKAKTWIKAQAHGSQRYGLLASSGAHRLRKYGIWIKQKIDPPLWFLNAKTDIRSSYFLEETATEFDVQGLELDWAVIAWDADLRIQADKNLGYYRFRGTAWQHINKHTDQQYLKNSYRVLLTRARQGMVIFVPMGGKGDPITNPVIYDRIYNFLGDSGIREL